jgi:predicted XRE-type DNA-binding protein
MTFKKNESRESIIKKTEDLQFKKYELRESILNQIDDLQLNQTQAAKIMSVTQSRVSDLSQRKVSKFTVELLTIMNKKIHE